MTKLNELEDIEEEYSILKSKNDDLAKDIDKLKSLIESCDASLDKLGKNLPSPNNKFSENIPFNATSLGNSFGKLVTGNINQDDFIISNTYKITQELLNLHKKEIMSGFTDIFSSFFAGARSSGGSVNQGKSYLVGERGYEIFSPTSRGNIERNNVKRNQNTQNKKSSFYTII